MYFKRLEIGEPTKILEVRPDEDVVSCIDSSPTKAQMFEIRLADVVESFIVDSAELHSQDSEYSKLF